MKLSTSFSIALFATALLCMPATADVTVVDFGAAQDNCCGDLAHVTFTGTVEAGDPAVTQFLHPNAATAQSNSAVLNLTDGATLSWTNVSAWTNTDTGTNPHEAFFLNRATDPLDTFFTVTTANPGDLVTIDFLSGPDRDSLITIDGVGTTIPSGTALGTPAWTNVVTDAVGSVTGELTEGSGDEGNIAMARITITSVPEPTSLALLGLGACTAVLRRRRS